MPRYKTKPSKNRSGGSDIKLKDTEESFLDDEEVRRIERELESLRRQKARHIRRMEQRKKENNENGYRSSSDGWEAAEFYEEAEEDRKSPVEARRSTINLAIELEKAQRRFMFNIGEMEKKYREKERRGAIETRIELDWDGNFYYPETIQPRHQQAFVNRLFQNDAMFGKGTVSAPRNSIQSLDGDQKALKKCQEMDDKFCRKLSRSDEYFDRNRGRVRSGASGVTLRTEESSRNYLDDIYSDSDELEDDVFVSKHRSMRDYEPSSYRNRKATTSTISSFFSKKEQSDEEGDEFADDEDNSEEEQLSDEEEEEIEEKQHIETVTVIKKEVEVSNTCKKPPLTPPAKPSPKPPSKEVDVKQEIKPIIQTSVVQNNPTVAESKAPQTAKIKEEVTTSDRVKNQKIDESQASSTVSEKNKTATPKKRRSAKSSEASGTKRKSADSVSKEPNKKKQKLSDSDILSIPSSMAVSEDIEQIARKRNLSTSKLVKFSDVSLKDSLWSTTVDAQWVREVKSAQSNKSKKEEHVFFGVPMSKNPEGTPVIEFWANNLSKDRSLRDPFESDYRRSLAQDKKARLDEKAGYDVRY